MLKVVSVHSSRGGVGKTLIAVNLAYTLSNKGSNVCLFDLDFRAPSLKATFNGNLQKPTECWLNDFLNGKCGVYETLVDQTQEYGTQGVFTVALANPSLEAVKDIATKDRRWEMQALRRLLEAKSELSREGKLDYLVLDTAPGIIYSSVNAVVSSDIVMVVTTFDAADMAETRRMIKELYKAFEKKTVIVVNKVPIELTSTPEADQKLRERLRSDLPSEAMQIVPCYCDILRSSRRTMFVKELPDHPFSRTIADISQTISSL